MNDIRGVGTTYKGVVTANDVVLAQSGEKIMLNVVVAI
jgi:hypothetical protein